MDDRYTKAGEAQHKLLTEFGVIVSFRDLIGLDEDILDYVNGSCWADEVGSDDQTFAAWCDQVFGLEEFGVKFRPQVALFSDVLGQTRIASIRDGYELAETINLTGDEGFGGGGEVAGIEPVKDGMDSVQVDIQKDFVPSIKRPKVPVIFLALDMWGIEGEYGDGGWHQLVRDFILNWVKNYPGQEAATIWSSVQPYINYESRTACYFAVSSNLSEGFLIRLENYLSAFVPGRCRIDGEIIITRDEWRIYSHIEAGSAWEKIDGLYWRTIVD